MAEIKNVHDETIKIYLPPSQKRIPKYSETDEVKIYAAKN